jgi:hypothetical protein
VQSHFFILCLFSLLVAVVFATLLKDDLRAQLRFGALVFGGFVATALVLGWVMYPFPR